MPHFSAKINGDTLELQMYGAVGNDYYGDGSTIDVKGVSKALSTAADAKTVNLWINSDGGDPFQALAIYQTLKTSGKKIVANIQGIAASAMTLICCAADEIIMNAGALYMIHEAQWGTYGTAAEQDAYAEATRKVNESAAQIYAARTGMDIDKIRSNMAATTWMTADEALSAGFATKVSTLKTMSAKLQPDLLSKAPDHIKPKLALLNSELAAMRGDEPVAVKPIDMSAERNRASAIVAASLLAGCPEMAVDLIRDPNQTVETATLRLQSEFIRVRAPMAGIGGPAHEQPRGANAKFEAEYRKESDYFERRGITQEMYIKSRLIDEKTSV